MTQAPVEPPAPAVHVPTWADTHLWPGWERDAFVEWARLQGADTPEPWAYFAEWWRIDGMWR